MNFQFDAGFNELLRKTINEVIREIGKANIIIVGDAGVGKSTLINAVFRDNIATTGSGRPVTKTTREYTKQDIPLTIFDTRGLEKGQFSAMFAELEQFIQQKQNSQDAHQHIHIAWLCIMEGSRRVQDADIQIAEMLSRYTSVVVVITKATHDQGFRREVQELIRTAKNVVRVHALEIQLEDGHVIRQKGLDDLVNLTMELVPESVKSAITRALNIRIQAAIDLKRKRANIAVGVAATAAAAIGSSPIPFSDAVLIVPAQVAMLTSISLIWGLDISETFLTTIISGAITSTSGTIGGRAFVGALLKFFPGIGTTVGAVISASTAAAITTTFGEAYIASLYTLSKKNPNQMPTTDEIRDEFQSRLPKAAALTNVFKR